MRLKTLLTHDLGWFEHFSHPDTALSYRPLMRALPRTVGGTDSSRAQMGNCGQSRSRSIRGQVVVKCCHTWRSVVKPRSNRWAAQEGAPYSFGNSEVFGLWFETATFRLVSRIQSLKLGFGDAKGSSLQPTELYTSVLNTHLPASPQSTKAD